MNISYTNSDVCIIDNGIVRIRIQFNINGVYPNISIQNICPKGYPPILNQQIQPLSEQIQQPNKQRIEKRKLSDFDKQILLPIKKNYTDIYKIFDNLVMSIIHDKTKFIINLYNNILNSGQITSFNIYINIREELADNIDNILNYYLSSQFKKKIINYINTIINDNDIIFIHFNYHSTNTFKLKMNKHNLFKKS